MELLKNLLAVYICVGLVYLAVMTVLAFVHNRKDLFEHSLLFFLCCVFTWPQCIYLATKVRK